MEKTLTQEQQNLITLKTFFKNKNFENINEILFNDSLYQSLKEKIFDIIKKNYDKRNIHVSFIINNQSYKLKLNSFLVNLILWNPFNYFKKEVTKEFIFDTKKLNNDEIANYMDKIIEYFKYEENYKVVSYVLSKIFQELGYISLEFNLLIANTINLKDKIDLAKRNPKYNELVHTTFDENTLTTNEIETQMKEKTKELYDILSTEDNNFRPYINAKEGINKDQLTQFEISIGPKPDLKGNVYPKIINTNFLRGLRSASDYQIDASGGRKAAIINNTNVKKSGYATRKLSILCIDTLLDYDNEDCGSKNYVKIYIDSDRTLKRFNMRYYNKDGKDYLIDENDTSLIGQTLNLRSPITCCSKHICRKCYGELAKINKDIHVGILGVFILTSQLTQMLLSAKHLLKTNSEKISIPEELEQYLVIEANSIVINPKWENYDKAVIEIDEDDINEIEEASSEDLSSEFDFNQSVNKFKIKYENEEKEFTVEKDLILSSVLKDEIDRGNKKDGIYHINLKDFGYDNPLFYIEVENSELSKHLNDILHLIDKDEYIDKIVTYDNMLQKFIELVNNGNINIMSVHIENIIRELVRDAVDYHVKPDFTKPNPNYKIYRLSASIINSSSIIKSFSFEKLKNQLYQPDTYEKNDSCMFDLLFSKGEENKEVE